MTTEEKEQYTTNAIQEQNTKTKSIATTNMQKGTNNKPDKTQTGKTPQRKRKTKQQEININNPTKRRKLAPNKEETTEGKNKNNRNANQKET